MEVFLTEFFVKYLEDSLKENLDIFFDQSMEYALLQGNRGLFPIIKRLEDFLKESMVQFQKHSKEDFINMFLNYLME